MNIEDITYKIRGAIFEVNNELGGGFLEKVYENALVLELKRQGLSVQSQLPMEVLFKGELVGEYIADLVVENSIIIEIKAVSRLASAYEAQLLNYLKASGMRIGFLVNFYGKKADIKRYVLD
jgi:GxxExxY protein